MMAMTTSSSISVNADFLETGACHGRNLGEKRMNERNSHKSQEIAERTRTTTNMIDDDAESSAARN